GRNPPKHSTFRREGTFNISGERPNCRIKPRGAPQRIIGVRVTVIYREPATSSTAAHRLRKDGLQESRTHRLRRSTKTTCRHVGLRDQMPNLGGFSARTHPRQSLLR